MSNQEKSSVEKAHDKGEQDRAEGKEFTLPHGQFEQILTFDSKGTADNKAENKAYEAGWDNHKSQTK